MANKTERYTEFLKKHLLKQNPDALLWLLAYGLYVHDIDDIIDQDIPKDFVREQFMLRVFEFAEVVYSNHFYIQNVNKLRPLVKMTSNAYMDAIQWESSKETWKAQVADGLRQIGNEICLAVIEIVGGIEARREASLELREISYWLHHTIEGQPI